MTGDFNLVIVVSYDFVYFYNNEELDLIESLVFFDHYDILDYLIGKRLYSYEVKYVCVEAMSSIRTLKQVYEKYKVLEKATNEHIEKGAIY